MTCVEKIDEQDVKQKLLNSHKRAALSRKILNRGGFMTAKKGNLLE